MRLWRRILPIFAAYMWTKHRCDLDAKLRGIRKDVRLTCSSA